MDPSLQAIECDMRLLQQTMEVMHDIVLNQQPKIDTIEDVIMESKKSVQTGGEIVQEAATIQTTYYYYIAGAMTSIGATVALLLLL